MSTPRAPSNDHIAISIAPVSEPATIPTRQSVGMPRIARERSTTSTRRARPAADRCERPDNAPSSTAGDHPGRLAQGPEEKHGLPGRRFGFIAGFLKFRRPKLMEAAPARQCDRPARHGAYGSGSRSTGKSCELARFPLKTGYRGTEEGIDSTSCESISLD